MAFVPDNDNFQGAPNRLGYRAIKLAQAYLEDGLAGYTSDRSIQSLSNEIINMLMHAGAVEVSLQAGKDTTSGRPAFLLRFVWGGLTIQVAQVTLPIRVVEEQNERLAKRKKPSTPKQHKEAASQDALYRKRQAAAEGQAKRQALYNLHETVRMELERRHYQPQMLAFAGYVLPPGSDKTVGELIASDEFPLLSAPK